MHCHKPTHLLFSLILLLSGSGSINAHAIITKTTLDNNAIAAGKARQVTINFNAKIETALSQVYLVSKGDQQTQLVLSIGNEPGQIMVNIPELNLGDYALRLKIFGADGHLTEDLLHFQVKQSL